MICEKCGSELVLAREEELDCPVCANWNVLDKESALKLMEKKIEWLENAFSVILRRFDKKRLIAWLLWEREKIATSFFKDKPMIPLAKFLSINILIKEISKIVDTTGSEEANEKNTLQLVETFSKFLSMIEWNKRIEEDFILLIEILGRMEDETAVEQGDRTAALRLAEIYWAVEDIVLTS